jgi:outer membrane protein OmpA-like peptidoglycan-associated protein
MKRNLIRTSIIAAFVVASASSSMPMARASDVQQLGSQPSYDQLLKSLTPDPSQIGKSRGLRVLSARTPEAGGSKAGSDTAASPKDDVRAPTIALDIRFATGSDVLTDAAHATVDRIGAALKSAQLSSFRFRLEGHTDSTGNPDANLALSQRRADAVKAYLVNNEGIQADRLETAGKGSSEPLDSEHPASGVNRRVQIVNLGQ